jgi:hypothetical protein
MPGSSHYAPSHPDGSDQNSAIRSSLMGWASWVVAKDGQSPALHHRMLLEELARICRGETDRLMVLMPPGSAKSTYASVNSDLWGAYVSTPAFAGTWYAWGEGMDGSSPSVYPTPFTVT